MASFDLISALRLEPPPSSPTAARLLSPHLPSLLASPARHGRRPLSLRPIHTAPAMSLRIPSAAAPAGGKKVQAAGKDRTVRALLSEFEATTEGEDSGGDSHQHQRRLQQETDSSNASDSDSADAQQGRADAARHEASTSSSSSSHSPSLSSASSLSKNRSHTPQDEDEHRDDLALDLAEAATSSTPSLTVITASRSSLSSPSYPLSPTSSLPSSPSAYTLSPVSSLAALPTPNIGSPLLTLHSRTASAPISSLASFPPAASIIVRGCYLLTQLDQKPTSPGLTFLTLHLTRTAAFTRPGLQVVQDEAVTRHIDLHRIIACTTAHADPHLLVVALSEQGERAKKEEGEEEGERVEFRLASQADAAHLVALVNGQPSPLRTMDCLHKGWVEQWTPQGWTRRFVRLFTHRLLVYRSVTSSLPVQVFPMNAKREVGGVEVSAGEDGQLVVEFNADKTGVSDVVWRCISEPSYLQWTDALQLTPLPPPTEQSTPSPTFSPSTPATLTSSAATPKSDSPASAGGSPTAPFTPSRPPVSLPTALSSQKAFMSYLLELSAVQPLFPSILMTAAAFAQVTPGSFLRKRNPALSTIDASLLSYHALLSTLSHVWCEARLVMVDEFEQSGSGQIGFCFPGFDSQVFDVGRLSVIACHQLLSSEAHPLRLTPHDYRLAMESSSPAKEMMQSSPDFSSLFASGQRELAKALAAQSQRLLLHHCTLASYMKAHQHCMQNGDALAWPDVRQAVQGSKNSDLQRHCTPVSYLYNPPATDLHELIVELKAQEKRSINRPYTSFPTAEPTAPTPTVSPVAAAAVGETLPAASPSPSPLSRRRFFGKGKENATPSSAKPKQSPASPATPTTPGTPPTAGSPTSPASPSAVEGEVRCLCDPVHLLFLLRTLLHYRRHALSNLLTTVSRTVPHLHASDKAGAQSVEALMAVGEEERSRVAVALSALPRAEDVEREVRRQRRERRERRAEAEVRRRVMVEKEQQTSLQSAIMTARSLIHAFEKKHGQDPYEEADQDDEHQDDEEEEEEEEEEEQPKSPDPVGLRVVLDAGIW